MTRPGAHGPWVRADRVIAISAAVAATLLAAGVPAARICVIPSTVSLPELAEAADTGPREGPIVAVGALTREKGHDVLLDAMALLLRHRPTTRLVIAGTGPLRAALQQQAGALGIAGQVELRGSLADIPSLLRQGAVLAHPSRREALGTAVLEAMAHGLPVVASETGGLGELLQDGAGLLVPPESPEALAVALLTVLTQPETARALAATARERVAAYAGDGMTGRVMQVYRSLCVAP
jgi:glycosyltransferase involved in cell wall biosynthesis